jgi:putative DNA primase/helicase
VIDFKRLNADLLARASTLVPSWLPDGKRSGVEWVAKNPRRDDRGLGSFKINLSTGVWQDFASGDSGSDLISLYAYLEGKGQAEAARDLDGDTEIRAMKPGKVPKGSKFVATGKPGPREATDRDRAWPKRGEVTAWWAVRDHDNRVLYYDVRFEQKKEDGTVSKDVLPLAWCRNTENGTERWGYKSFPEPRPLYGFVAVSAAPPGAPVVVVEGMKCAEALSTVLGDKFPTVTWQGGSNAIHKADWEPLAGHRVLVWPDNDTPGADAAIQIMALLEGLGCEVAAILPHEEATEGWDVADLIESGADRATVLGYMKGNKVPAQEFRRLHRSQEELPGQNGPPEFEDLPPEAYEQEEQGARDLRVRPFRVLGHDRENYFYLPRAKGQIVPLKMSSHTKNNLLSLAPISWWEDAFPSKRGVSWTAAQNELMREADRCGPFSASKIRGRGAWRDKKDLIVHVGDHLVVNGQEADPIDYEGSFIYERGVRLHQGANQVAPASLGKEVIELCKMFPWRSEVHGVLSAGWAFLAPICGALYWRPHVWITGEPGSGKSWFRDNVIAPFVRDFGIIAQGSTSAAGARQELGADALPILFDEAESNDKKSAERIAEVLELMRQSSMSGESAIIKGSAHGESVSYAPSSMWCLSSVVTAIKHQADQGRISILELCKYSESVAQHKGRSLREQHRVTADLVARLFTRENCQALRARAFKRLPTILETVETFREQAADHFGNQRAGDQIGTLLAGAYCLASDGRIPAAKALEYIKSQDWGEVIKEDEQEEDHDQLVRHIVQHVVRVNTPADGSLDRTIGQLIKVGFSEFSPNSLNKRVARDALSVFGIFLGEHPTKKDIYISPRHRGIERILYGTPWGVNYARVLLRVPGVTQTAPRPVEDLSGRKTSRRLICLDAGALLLSEFEEGSPTATKEQQDLEFWEKEGFDGW